MNTNKKKSAPPPGVTRHRMRRSKGGTRQVSIRVPEELAAMMDELSAKDGISLAGWFSSKFQSGIAEYVQREHNRVFPRGVPASGEVRFG